MNNDNTPSRTPGRRGRRAVAMTVLWASAAAGTTAVATTVAATNDGSNAVSASAGSSRTKQEALATAAPAAVHGVAADGSTFDGTFVLNRFREHKGTLYAVGQLEGQLGGQPVSKKVSLPVTGGSNEAPVAGMTQPQGFAQLQAPVPTPGACSILTLDLGPLDLDLLGLRVALAPVQLLIEAIPDPGNLLGNLLCAVAGLLDGGLGSGLGGLIGNLLGAIANLLNGILAV